MLQVNSQSVVRGSLTLTVPLAGAPAPFYVVIHEGDRDSIEGTIGSTELLQPGTHMIIRIKIDRELKGNEYVWAMLYSEENGNTTFDGAKIDSPIVAPGAGNPRLGDLVAFGFDVSLSGIPAPPPAGNAGIAGDRTASTAWGLMALGATVALASAARIATRRGSSVPSS